MGNFELKRGKGHSNVPQRSDVPRAPLPNDERKKLLSSLVWQERAQVALESDLSMDDLAALVRDEEVTVRQLTYDLHRDISPVLLNEVLALYPDDAPRMAYQVHAPLAALRLKRFNFASRDDIERYLAGIGADEATSRAFLSIVKSPETGLLTLDELMGTVSH
ncbi:hypothetical protein [Cryobacterium cryoconiti]|uniref:Uncharacterized protein n=1 Tax=Cryobacterium cryoconiti TaxID=1259239 RepID=A0A4Y8JRC3_9MICO|nr:hypothetical protein [Cryobacterium cryoconiti]TFD26253.1 hypothetical protein E3T49_15710 [Cryobacterium cryoconiti]